MADNIDRRYTLIYGKVGETNPVGAYTPKYLGAETVNGTTYDCWKVQTESIAKLRYERSVRRIVTSLEAGTVAFTLGCGHTVTIGFSHQVVSIGALSIELGDEMDCDQCQPPGSC